MSKRRLPACDQDSVAPWGWWNISVLLHNSWERERERRVCQSRTSNHTKTLRRWDAPPLTVSQHGLSIVQSVFSGPRFSCCPNSGDVSGRLANRAWCGKRERRVALSWEGAAVGAMPARLLARLLAALETRQPKFILNSPKPCEAVQEPSLVLKKINIYLDEEHGANILFQNHSP